VLQADQVLVGVIKLRCNLLLYLEAKVVEVASSAETLTMLEEDGLRILNLKEGLLLFPSLHGHKKATITKAEEVVGHLKTN